MRKKTKKSNFGGYKFLKPCNVLGEQDTYTCAVTPPDLTRFVLVTLRHTHNSRMPSKPLLSKAKQDSPPTALNLVRQYSLLIDIIKKVIKQGTPKQKAFFTFTLQQMTILMTLKNENLW